MVLALTAQGISVLPSKQNLLFGARLRDRAYVLEKGEIRCHGGMDEQRSIARVQREIQGFWQPRGPCRFSAKLDILPSRHSTMVCANSLLAKGWHMVLNIDEISRLYETRGEASYVKPQLTQRQHAMQCAWLAEQAQSTPELVAAALLHDLGHLLASYAEQLPPDADDGHQYIPIPFLRRRFTDAVIEPIRLHVEAKRYLCGMDSSYWARLSDAARRRLSRQGGPFSEAEAATFLARPFAADALRIRQWDDLAQDPHAKPPPWSHFADVLMRVSRGELATA